MQNKRLWFIIYCSTLLVGCSNGNLGSTSSSGGTSVAELERQSLSKSCGIGQSCDGYSGMVYAGDYNSMAYYSTPGACSSSGANSSVATCPTAVGSDDTALAGTVVWAGGADSGTATLADTSESGTTSQRLASILVTQYPDLYAAQFCQSLSQQNFAGHNDWYLPSSSELYWMQNQSFLYANALNFLPNGSYWSSTETSAITAEVAIYSLTSGPSRNSSSKTQANHVRCIRHD